MGTMEEYLTPVPATCFPDSSSKESQLWATHTALAGYHCDQVPTVAKELFFLLCIGLGLFSPHWETSLDSHEQRAEHIPKGCYSLSVQVIPVKDIAL